MINRQSILRYTGILGLSALAGVILAGCASSSAPTPAPAAPAPQAAAATPAPAAAPTPAPAAAPEAAPAPAPTAATTLPTIRIKAGSDHDIKDSKGNTWLADTGFDGGDVIARPDIKIDGTTEPELYQSEHYSMTGFTYSVPNGKYTVNLYFCESYEDITAAGQRVFSVNVQGHDIKDLDIFAKAGGSLKPDIETVPIEVTDGKVHITFTANVQNPAIDAIEIIPQS